MSNPRDGWPEPPSPAPGNPEHHGFVSMFIFWPPFSLGLSSTDFLHPTRQPDYLIHDRDAVYGRDFGDRPSQLGITSVRTPFRASP